MISTQYFGRNGFVVDRTHLTSVSPRGKLLLLPPSVCPGHCVMRLPTPVTLPTVYFPTLQMCSLSITPSCAIHPKDRRRTNWTEPDSLSLLRHSCQYSHLE